MQQLNWSELAPPLVFMVAMLIMFWYLVIKPARTRQQRHASLVETVKVGDEIVTVGGLYGKVVKLQQETLDLEVAPNVRLRFDRRAVRRQASEKDQD